VILFRPIFWTEDFPKEETDWPGDHGHEDGYHSSGFTSTDSVAVYPNQTPDKQEQEKEIS